MDKSREYNSGGFCLDHAHDNWCALDPKVVYLNTFFLKYPSVNPEARGKSYGLFSTLPNRREIPVGVRSKATLVFAGLGT